MNPFTMKRLQAMTLSSFMMLAAAGCGGETPDQQPVIDEPVAEEAWDAEQEATIGSTALGAYLFTKETFNGNGRTCATCHTLGTGTLSPAQAQAVYAKNRRDPLFRAIDSNDGTGASYSDLLNHATVTVDIPMAPNVRLASNPSARTVKLRRGIPTTLDSPRFDPVIMLDGREPTLQSQALHAIQGHAQGARAPTQNELNAIVDFEKALFSSRSMLNYAATGTPPALPAGVTDSQKRGRVHFLETGLCGGCHSGGALNTMSAFNPVGLPAGFRFSTIGVSEFNLGQNPPKEFIVTNPDGTETPVVSPDPGLMLLTGNPQMAGAFKITSLRNIKNTAPYFHDNSAKNLDQVMLQYKLVFQFLGIPVSDQDLADMKAYMQLL